MRPIIDVAADLGLAEEDLEPYGRHKAKLPLHLVNGDRPAGKLVLVSGISPTPAGEGKTTLSIGLTQGLWRLGKKAVAALRAPSQGPVFGRKGGGAGGGKARLLPFEDINLHFTGDLHAIAAANNLLAALIDNHLYFGNELRLDTRALTWKRCLDVNDRALRHVVTGLGGKLGGVPRETAFEITAASEVMAILSLASSPADLIQRLERTVVGPNEGGKPVTAADLGAAGPMAALLRDALLPNLVQTLEGTPALVHGGPFGNIAHGCSSVLGTRMGLALGEICVTEAGFGADLGAEKFLNIKARQTGLWPDAAVVVATVRALKLQGGVALADLERDDVAALRAGFPNLRRHVENLRKFGLPVVVAINHFQGDSQAELEALLALCGEIDAPAAVADIWTQGGAGALELGQVLLRALEQPSRVSPLYPDDLPLVEKIETVAREIYHAEDVRLSRDAEAALQRIEGWGYGRLPVCVAKTQYSFSDNPELLGAAEGHHLTVRDAKLSAGAGFVVVYAGEIQTMPGLPRRPAADHIRLTAAGEIEGVS